MNRLTTTLALLSTAVSALAQTPPGNAPGFLTLEETLLRIDRNHPKLAAARQEIDAARGKAREKRGAFDPVVSVGSDMTRYNSSTYQGKAYNMGLNEAIVEMLTPSGLKFFGGSRLNGGNIKSPASNTGETGEYFFGVKLPLLRGNGLNEKGVAERQARFGIDLAEQTVATFRLGMLRDGAGAYWEWVAAGERLNIARNLLSLARIRGDAIRQRFQTGDVPLIDSVEADTEVRRREGSLVKAERDLQKAAFKLGLYLWDQNGEAGAIPATIPPIGEAQPLSLTDITAAQRTAVEKRPEIQSFAPVLETLRLTRDLARNDRRPAFDLVAGTGLDTGFGSIGPTWKLGLMYSIPLRQNSADGRIDEAEAKLRKLELDRTNAVQQVRIEVADAANAVETAAERVELARAELSLARRLEEGERARFELGEGTLFLLNQRERATAEAAARLVDVMAELKLANVTLRAAMGEL